MARTDDIPEAYDERSVLLQMLHYAQDTAVMKVSGLSQELARRAPLETSPLMSPANILNHLRWVERSWVDTDLFGGPDEAPWTAEHPDGEMEEGSTLPFDEVVALYEEQTARTRAVFAEVDLDMVRRNEMRPQPVTARWILVHLVEETARHNGHLDILRELADGTKGD
ncbi:DinB family protein [Aeromicrobium fastidiosum]|uniref:DinB family protein n=1 Tax=Aeromicrobium fastidiosum TaxID=52699 RepID=A0A641AL84_9ACTN|nr:DinB family protein [Aeromicrobium fastidiosum]KAA1374664.1 DinB family protein [Aeromicrobium fastidiosum]MBP2390789.1 putative damage-inducible protein DinB [Aeromicrobium fastidiosum]